MRNPPENQHAVSHKKLAYWENHFWESSMMTLSSFPIKFRSCRGKLIKIKQDEKRFVNISFKGLKMTLACWIWMIWTMLTTGLCAASATLAVSPNLATKCWIDFLSGTLFLPKSLLHCRCVRRTDFMAKYTLIIFTCCCIVNHSFGSILMSKESRRPAVYTTWGTWKKNCKIQLWDENQSRVLYWTTLYVRWDRIKNHAQR